MITQHHTCILPTCWDNLAIAATMVNMEMCLLYGCAATMLVVAESGLTIGSPYIWSQCPTVCQCISFQLQFKCLAIILSDGHLTTRDDIGLLKFEFSRYVNLTMVMIRSYCILLGKCYGGVMQPSRAPRCTPLC